jgi:hypothetical protein
VELHLKSQKLHPQSQQAKSLGMGMAETFGGIIIWLVVLAILKKISQWEGLSHILWKIENVQTTNQL